MEASNGREWIPRLGMEFESTEQGWEFWIKYSGKKGFNVRKSYCNHSYLDGVITSRAFVCTNEGFRKKDKRDDQTLYPRQETRTGCPVRLVLRVNRKTKKYEVGEFIDEHNHILQLPQACYLLPCQRKVTEVAACDIDLADDSGIRPKATHELMGRQVGGLQNLGHTIRDQNNYLRNKRKGALIHGEAISILMYFCKQALKNPSFQHEEQVDDQQEISNIFWAEAQMIIDYGQFGDVVIFDTTHGTNKDHRPFGVFVGLNHFRETVIFGAVLLYDQTIESFEWVFNTFLKAHNNKKPKSIFTDQDAAMGIAIANVMPEVTHNLCTWHISENATKNLIRYGNGIVGEFKACLFGIEEESEFEKVFSDLKNKVGGTWLPFIYKSKEKWAYCYTKSVFSLGIRSTQLSESMNNFLKSYLKSDMDIVRFFNQFERVVADKREKEVVSEYEYRKKIPRIKVKVPVLLQASERYTPKIFELFQIEYELAMAAQIEGPVADEYIVTISDLVDVEQASKRCCRVLWNEIDQTVSCSCKKFEKWGFLCSHALKVLDTMNIKLLPEKYMLKRWTHEARDGVIHDRNGVVVENPKLDVTRRNRELCRKFTKIAAKAAGSEESSAFVDGVLDDLEMQVGRMMISVPNTSADHMDNLPQTAFSLKKRDDKKGGKRHKSWVENLTKKRTNTTNDKPSKKQKLSACTMPSTSSMLVEASNSVCNSDVTLSNSVYNSDATLSNSVFTLPSNHIEDDAFIHVIKNSNFKENADPYFRNITLTPF